MQTLKAHPTMVNLNRPIALLWICAALQACAPEVPPVEGPRPVLSQLVQASAGPDNLDGIGVYTGEVRARHEAEVAFRVGGKLVARRVDVGAVVHAGSVLGQLDDADFRLHRDAAQAAVRSTEADFRLAEAELARQRKLLEKRFISRAVLEQHEAAFKASQARWAQAQAQFELSRRQVDYAALTADRDGVITAVLAEVGQVLGAGQGVFRLAQPAEKEVLIYVPETRLTDLGSGELGVRLLADPHLVLRGRLRELAPSADAATRTFAARVTILDAPAAVGLGMTASVISPGARAKFILPLGALTQLDGQPVVWLVDPQTHQVQPRVVEVAEYREDGVALSAGVHAGERVVVAGVHKLHAGELVRLPAGTTP